MAKRKALGRGLGAILPPEQEQALATSEIPLNQIERNRFQPRQEFDEEALKELAASIEVHGIIQPITVRKVSDNEYELISGERRLRASKLAKLKKIPAYVRTANDEQMLEMALIENIQREDLNPVEVALSYQRLIDEMGITQEKVGDKVGKKRATVTNYLGLLNLPPQIVTGLREKKVSMGHARALKSVDDPVVQLRLYDDIQEKHLSVRQVEAVVRALKEDKKADKAKAKSPHPHQIHLDQLSGKLEEKFGNRVKMKQKNNGAGEIAISFSSNEDLDRILDILGIA